MSRYTVCGSIRLREKKTNKLSVENKAEKITVELLLFTILKLQLWLRSTFDLKRHLEISVHVRIYVLNEIHMQTVVLVMLLMLSMLELKYSLSFFLWF